MEERYGVKHMMHEIGSVHILSYSNFKCNERWRPSN